MLVYLNNNVFRQIKHTKFWKCSRQKNTIYSRMAHILKLRRVSLVVIVQDSRSRDSGCESYCEPILGKFVYSCKVECLTEVRICMGIIFAQ